MRYVYPVTVTADGDGFGVTCECVPELVTCGDTRAEALARAEDALVTALSFYVDNDETIPKPPRHPIGLDLVVVPALAAAKLALHDAMLAQGVSNIEMGRRIGLNEKAMWRLRDPLVHSHIGQVQTALHSLGLGLVLEVVERPGRCPGPAGAMGP